MDTLSSIYNDVRQGFQSEAKLFAKAKAVDTTITHKLVKQFLASQEVSQIYQRRIEKHRYPLLAHAPFERMQCDLLDLTNENPRLNGGTKFLFIAIDVFTRYVIISPQKDKSLPSCLASLEHLLLIVSELSHTIRQLDSDNESAFTSNQFTALCVTNNITQNFATPGDHARLGVVDRFSRTFRGYLSKYQTAYQTQKYFPILQDLVYNYNNTVHSSLKSTPTEAITQGGITDYIQKQTAKASAVPYNQLHYPDGTRVRVLVPKSLFSKGSSTWSTTVYTITGYENGLHYVDGLAEGKRKSELLFINDVITAPQRIDPPNLEARKMVQALERRVSRRIAKEGVERSDLKEKTDEEKSQRAITRKQVDRGLMMSY